MLKLPFRSACAAWFVALSVAGCSADDISTVAEESEVAASTGATFAPAPEVLARTRAVLDARLRAFDGHAAKREGARPFYRLHPAGERVHGTVLVLGQATHSSTCRWTAGPGPDHHQRGDNAADSSQQTKAHLAKAHAVFAGRHAVVLL